MKTHSIWALIICSDNQAAPFKLVLKYHKSLQCHQCNHLHPYSDLRVFVLPCYLFSQTKCKTCCYDKKIKSTTVSISPKRCQNHRTKFSLIWIQVSVRFDITQTLFDLKRRKQTGKVSVKNNNKKNEKCKEKKIYKSPKPKYASKCTFPVLSSSFADSLTCCASLWCAKLRTWPAALYGLQLSPACMHCSWGKQASQTFINISLLLLPCSLLLSLMLSPFLLNQLLHTYPASRNYDWNYICHCLWQPSLNLI